MELVKLSRMILFSIILLKLFMGTYSYDILLDEMYVWLVEGNRILAWSFLVTQTFQLLMMLW